MSMVMRQLAWIAAVCLASASPAGGEEGEAEIVAQAPRMESLPVDPVLEQNLTFVPVPSPIEAAAPLDLAPAPSSLTAAVPQELAPASSALQFAEPATPAYPVTPPQPPGAAERPTLPLDVIGTLLQGEVSYTLGPSDVVQIVVRGQSDFSGSYVVGPDGILQYGYVGDIQAGGLTKDELRTVLTEALKRYVRIPDVNVAIVGFNSKVVYLLGEVGRPGKYLMRGDSIKLRDAVVAAGMPSDRAALSRVVVVTPDAAKPKRRKINLKEVMYQGKLRNDIDLVAGETVIVPITVWGKITDIVGRIVRPFWGMTRLVAGAAFL